MGKVSNFKKQISNLNFAKPHGVSLNFPKKQKEKERKKERKINCNHWGVCAQNINKKLNM